jgi:hypothetical protein
MIWLRNLFVVSRMSLRSLSRNLATNTRSRKLEYGEDNEMGESVVRVGTRLVLRLATGFGNLWVASTEGREMGCLELRVSMITHKYAYMLQAQWNRQISRMEIYNAIYTLAKERTCINYSVDHITMLHELGDVDMSPGTPRVPCSLHGLAGPIDC